MENIKKVKDSIHQSTSKKLKKNTQDHYYKLGEEKKNPVGHSVKQVTRYLFREAIFWLTLV